MFRALTARLGAKASENYELTSNPFINIVKKY